MKKLPSYEELQNSITKLESELLSLKSNRSKIPSNISANLFYDICEYSKNAVVLLESFDNGKSFKIKYCNKKAEEFEKINQEKIVGKNLVELFPSVINSGFLEALRRVFKLNKAEEFPAVSFVSGKIMEWKQNYIYKLSNSEIVSIYVDETINKNKEFELKEHQEKLQIAMEAANYFSFEIDLPTYKISALKDLYIALGYSEPELNSLLKKAGSLIHPDDYKKAKELISKHARGIKAPLNLEFRVKDKSGKWFWFNATGRIIEWNKNSKPLKLVGLVRMIQDEKEILLRLQESEEKFKSIATLLPEVVYETDLNGNLTFVNLKAYEIFEYEPEDFDRGLNIVQMLAPEDLQRAQKNIKILLYSGSVLGEEYTAITKTGKRFPIIVYTNAIKNKKTIA